MWYGLDQALGRGLAGQIVSVGAGCGLGLAVYAGAVALMRVPEAAQLWRLVSGRLRPAT